MKLEMDHQVHSVVFTGVIVTGIASVILGIAFFIYSFNVKSQEAVLQAPTCEHAVLLIGTEVTQRLLMCRIKQSATVLPATTQTGQ